MNATVKKTSALILASLILGVCFIIGVRSFKAYDREVSVRGLCEREVMADRAIYPIVFKEGGNDLVSLSKVVSDKNQKVIEFLMANGFTEDEISISAPRVTDRTTETDYSSQRMGYDYVMTSLITVYTTKVSLVLDLQQKQSELLNAGIAVGTGYSWEYPVIYSFEGLNDIKPEMIAEANRNARKAAEQFAGDSGSRLGKIKTATQGLFTIENRDQNTPQKKIVRVVTNVTYRLR